MASKLFSLVFRSKQFVYRAIKYQLTRPRPPHLPGLFGAPVVIVGSAPSAQKPIGIDGTYRIVSVNASQITAEAWDRVPDVTLLQYNQIEGQTTNAKEVRRVLKGRRTGILLVLLWRYERQRLTQGLTKIGYHFDSLDLVSRYERIALVHRIAGLLHFELHSSSKCSNGVIAAILALNSGASAVILSGINPLSTGHVYNKANLPRLHISKDLKVLQVLITLGWPIFTADEDVSMTTGLPIWNGQGDQGTGDKSRITPNGPVEQLRV